jgi:hypothetical protein
LWVECEEEERADMVQGLHKRVVIATMLISTLLWGMAMAANAPNVGDTAPDFLAFSTVGESVRLSDYQGKKNVMMFFFVRAFGGA